MEDNTSADISDELFDYLAKYHSDARDVKLEHYCFDKDLTVELKSEIQVLLDNIREEYIDVDMQENVEWKEDDEYEDDEDYEDEDEEESTPSYYDSLIVDVYYSVSNIVDKDNN